jgi:hypothetical protein
MLPAGFRQHGLKFAQATLTERQLDLTAGDYCSYARDDQQQGSSLGHSTSGFLPG